ncbi:MAG: formate dehydrogenase accessory protein FdhE [Desulfobacterales bacterium]|nr:formate dehydrogenase accessory protein FdhE [Desulfobacterales bacterium]
MTQTPYVPGQSTDTESGPELAQSLIYDVTQEQIAGTAESISKIRPAYADLIEFYSRVFAAQAATRAGLNPAPIIIDPQTLQLKLDNQMPLISPEEFRIDTEACGKLLDEICRLALAHAPKLAQAGETLAGCLEEGSIDLEALFRDLLDAGDISKTAEACGITVEALAFFGFSAMAPSVQAGAAQLAVYLKDAPKSQTHWCPICGNQPDLSFLDEAGKRQVCCSLCNHIWQTRRMGCLFCDSATPEDQQYFFTKEEPEFRVYCCDSCKRYIKTIDTRQMGRRFFPKLEQVTTLHLDIQAREKGYRPPAEVSH